MTMGPATEIHYNKKSTSNKIWYLIRTTTFSSGNESLEKIKPEQGFFNQTFRDFLW